MPAGSSDEGEAPRLLEAKSISSAAVSLCRFPVVFSEIPPLFCVLVRRASCAINTLELRYFPVRCSRSTIAHPHVNSSEAGWMCRAGKPRMATHTMTRARLGVNALHGVRGAGGVRAVRGAAVLVAPSAARCRHEHHCALAWEYRLAVSHARSFPAHPSPKKSSESYSLGTFVHMSSSPLVARLVLFPEESSLGYCLPTI